MSKAILAAMSEAEPPEAMRLAAKPGPEDAAMGRIERIGSRWRVRDDALWNPFEVVSFLLWIVFGFGWLMGGRNYGFMIELFLPVIVLGVAVILGQAVMRRRAGEAGVLRLMRERIR